MCWGVVLKVLYQCKYDLASTSTFITGTASVADMTPTFETLGLMPQLLKALHKQKYEIPTPIQQQAIPQLLAGKDLVGIAQTGTGKTAAFVLPILHNMVTHQTGRMSALVLAPTRELAAQIDESFAAYGEFLPLRHTAIFGGVGQGRQVEALRKGVEVLVATPGRLLDLMEQGHISLRSIRFFVLDEADRMLDMGFIHDIKKIISKLPKQRQSLFFSATMPPAVSSLAKTMLCDPVRVEVSPSASTVERIRQCVFFVDNGHKDQLLLELLGEKHLTSVLVFTATKHRANKLSTFLTRSKFPAQAIHGNKSQTARTKALQDFKSGKVSVLVATDIAARGIDVDNISHVINYDLPNEPENYVHRIGRTARAGADGTAYSLCCASERNYLRDIERLTQQPLEVMKHSMHSATAQHASGSSARPPPRQQRGRRQSTSRRVGGSSGRQGRGAAQSRGSSRRPSGSRSGYRRGAQKSHT